MDVHLKSPLLTDLYQFTMAYGYWKLGIAERPAVFHLFFRKNPFHGQYAITCGLMNLINFLKNYQFSDEDLHYLQNLKNPQNQPLFDTGFCNYLKNISFQCDVDAIAEGELIFAHEPLVRVKGPLAQCQLIESTLVNLINFPSLIATKASLVCAAAQGDPVIEFGVRRAQGPNGGLTASYAAYIGGCESTSNVLAGQQFQIPVKGTVAHSWIMVFDDELTAFEKCSEVMENNVILLVDTYNTIQGVNNAICIGQQLRKKGQDLLAVRLDSGDLNQLSKKTRELLDQAGFINTQIIASGDLDEQMIKHLKDQSAPIDIWGVGTKLVTSYNQPSLDIAYKLSAIQNEKGVWQYKIKRSDHPGKTTNPGILQIRRFYQNEKLQADIVYDEELGLSEIITESTETKDLLIPIFRQGQLVYQQPNINERRQFCQQQLKKFYATNLTKEYPVKLDQSIQNIKNKLLEEDYS